MNEASTLEALTPQELELVVLSSLRSVEALRAAMNAGINDNSWQVPEHAKCWLYMQARALAGHAPTRVDVQLATDVVLNEEITDDETFRDELIKQTIHREAIAKILSRAEELETDPKRAVEGLVADLSEISYSVAAHTRYFDHDIEERMAVMTARAEQRGRGELVGVPTGLPVLDRAGDNWKMGDIVVVQGPLNAGKSTLLLYLCAYAYFHGKQKVLFLSPESTIDDINDRLSPMIGRFMGYDFSNKGLRDGVVDLDEYQRYLEEMQLWDRKDFIVRDAGDMGSFGIDEIVQLAREHRPTILAIDGVHLITGRGKSWEVMKASGQALKGLAHSLPCVVIGGTQVIRSAVDSDDPAGLDQAAYGMGLMESANKVISLNEKRGDTMTRVWKLVKNRDGLKVLTRQLLHFDVDRGAIGEQGAQVVRPEGAVDQVAGTVVSYAEVEEIEF